MLHFYNFCAKIVYCVFVDMSLLFNASKLSFMICKYNISVILIFIMKYFRFSFSFFTHVTLLLIVLNYILWFIIYWFPITLLFSHNCPLFICFFVHMALLCMYKIPDFASFLLTKKILIFIFISFTRVFCYK